MYNVYIMFEKKGLYTYYPISITTCHKTHNVENYNKKVERTVKDLENWLIGRIIRLLNRN